MRNGGRWAVGAALVMLTMGTMQAGSRARTAPATMQELEVARIFIEYNSTDQDLGFHVFLDGEDWKEIRILNPRGQTIFQVQGRGGFGRYGMTELFFEGAEPELADVPLETLLREFPEGTYRFLGKTVDGALLTGMAELTHASPDGPQATADVNGNTVVIRWDEVDAPPDGFPDRDIVISGYQVLVDESLDVKLPASARQLTLPDEFVQGLEPGLHHFEVLAIEEGGNQTIFESTFIR